MLKENEQNFEQTNAQTEELEVKRIDRVVAVIINSAVYCIPYLGFVALMLNWYLYATQGRTLGSIIMKFSTLRPDGTPPGFGGSIEYGILDMVRGIFIILTLSIFFWYEVATMEKRNGNFAEKWTNQIKKFD